MHVSRDVADRLIEMANGMIGSVCTIVRGVCEEQFS